MQQPPIEIAVEVVEQYTCISSGLTYEAYVHHANLVARKRALGDIRPYVDHVLSLLVWNQFLIRTHTAPGVISYTPSERWSQRDAVLALLRAPKQVVRAWRIREQEARRAQRELLREERERLRRQEADARHLARMAAMEERRLAMIAERGLTSNGRIRRLSRIHQRPVQQQEFPLS